MLLFPAENLEVNFLSLEAFLTPANAMLSVELTNLANILDATGKAHNISQLARHYSSTIEKAIWDTTLVDNIFAYETNGGNVSIISWIVS